MLDSNASCLIRGCVIGFYRLHNYVFDETSEEWSKHEDDICRAIDEGVKYDA